MKERKFVWVLKRKNNHDNCQLVQYSIPVKKKNDFLVLAVLANPFIAVYVDVSFQESSNLCKYNPQGGDCTAANKGYLSYIPRRLASQVQ